MSEEENNENMKLLVVGFLGAIAGVFLLLSFQQLSKAQAHQDEVEKEAIVKKRPSIFDDSFFNESPFDTMDKFRERFFGDFDEDFFSPRSSFFNIESQKNYSLSQRETDEYFIYEISLEDSVVGDSLDISVKNGMVTISGQKETNKKSGEDNSQSYFSSISSFSQSFSVPQDVDSENVITEHQGKKIILKFPKYREEV